MTTDWYAPNQQAVRADASGPAEQGQGGSSTPPPVEAPVEDDQVDDEEVEASPKRSTRR